jgi:N-acetylglucosamine-6-phosphate deacetylase
LLGPVPVIAEGGSVRLADGMLAGSTLTMDAAVRHAISGTGLPITDVARAAATTPAGLLGIADRVGSLSPGKAADLVVLGDDLRVREVLTGGRPLHGLIDLTEA